MKLPAAKEHSVGYRNDVTHYVPLLPKKRTRSSLSKPTARKVGMMWGTIAKVHWHGCSSQFLLEFLVLTAKLAHEWAQSLVSVQYDGTTP